MKERLKFDELGNTFTMGFDDVTTIHGKDGKDGKDGADGYTPIKGVDYYTEEDKSELISEVSEEVKADVYTKQEVDAQFEGMGQSVVDAIKQVNTNNEAAIEELKTDLSELENKFEKWEKVVDVTITEPISTSFRQEFGKRFKKIRFKMQVVGTGTAYFRFKRDYTDAGGTSYGSANFFKIPSVNLSSTRFIVGTAYFDLDGYICVKDGIYTTQSSTFATGSTTAQGDFLNPESERFFDEIFFYFGTDCTITSGKVEVWGCEI